MIFGVSGLCTKVAIIPLSAEGFVSFPLAISGYVILLGLGSISHILCVFTDPGSLPQNTDLPPIEDPNDPSSRRTDYCRKCRTYKPNRTHHCSVCKRCIQKMDHHCPWVNNCVGLYNQKLFLLFLLYIELACLYSFLWLFLRSTYCYSHKEVQFCKRGRKAAAEDVLLGLIAVFGAALFALFIGVMMYDQIYCIMNNTTGIDSLKHVKTDKRPVRESFKEVFGGRFSIRWFLPIPISRRDSEFVKESEL